MSRADYTYGRITHEATIIRALRSEYGAVLLDRHKLQRPPGFKAPEQPHMPEEER